MIWWGHGVLVGFYGPSIAACRVTGPFLISEASKVPSLPDAGSVTLNKLGCSKQACLALNTLAWNNKIGLGWS